MLEPYNDVLRHTHIGQYRRKIWRSVLQYAFVQQSGLSEDVVNSKRCAECHQ